jgi:hypothetical protein
MMLVALFVILTESVISVPASHWSAIELRVPQHSSIVHVSYKVERGSGVQAMVLTRADAERLHRGRSVDPLYASGYAKSSRFQVPIPDAGDYVLVLDNQLDRFPAEVAIRLELNHSGNVRVSTVPPERRRATVALSMMFFGAVVVFSALKFLRS